MNRGYSIAIIVLCAVVLAAVPTQAAIRQIYSYQFTSDFDGWSISGWPSWERSGAYYTSGYASMHCDRTAYFSSSLYKDFSFVGWAKAELRYNYWLDMVETWDRLGVYISTDQGNNWTLLELYHTGYDTHEGGPNAAQWHSNTINLNSYIGQVVRIRFRFYCSIYDYSLRGGAYIDDIEIWGTQACTLSVVSDGNGTVTPAADTVDEQGNTVAISATANPGYTFSRWMVTSGDGVILDTSSSSTSIVLQSSLRVTAQANFQGVPYTLTVNNDGRGTTNPSGSQTVYHNDTNQVIASAGTGYTFSHWAATSGTASINDTGNDTTTVTLTAGDAAIQANFDTSTYTLEIDDDGNGTTTPSGQQTVKHGVANAISASPSTGYLFSYWATRAGSPDIADSTSASTTVTLTGDAEVRAMFSIITYSLTVENDGNGSTNPSGSQTVDYGAATQIGAAPNPGYSFSKWTVTSGTAAISDSLDDTTTVALASGDAAVQANFVLNDYTLTVSSGGNGVTDPSGATGAGHGVPVGVTAAPDEGYQFDNWTVTSGSASFGNANDSSTTATLSSGDATVQANFSIKQYYLTVNASQGGRVSPTPGVTVDHGSPVPIRASVSQAGYEFLYWTVTSGEASVADSTNPNTTIALTNGPATVLAQFGIITNPVVMQQENGGVTIPIDTLWARYDSAETIIAIPDTGYNFSYWDNVNGIVTIDDANNDTTTLTTTWPSSTIRAVFTPYDYLLTVTNDGNGITTPADTQTVYHNVAQNISCSPGANYIFSHWSVTVGGAAFGDSTASFTDVTLSSGPATIKANFKPQYFNLTVGDDGNGTTNVDGTMPVNNGGGQTIQAFPNSGYAFSHWSTVNGTPVFDDTTANPAEVTLSVYDSEVRANFSRIPYTLTVSDTGYGTTTPAGAQTVYYGDIVQLIADPDTGNEFFRWNLSSGAGTIDDANNDTTTITISTSDATVHAYFRPITFSLTVSGDINGFTNPSGTQSVNFGAPTQVIATPNSGYLFSHWDVASGTAVVADSLNDTTTVSLFTESAFVRANFVLAPYTLTVSNDGNGATSPAGDQQASQGDPTTIIALANPGYDFFTWTTVSGIPSVFDPSNDTTTVTLNSGDGEVRADFMLKSYQLTVNNDGNGSTNPSGLQVVNHGVARQITATPGFGYEFARWTLTSGSAAIADTADNTTNVTLTSGSATITAEFRFASYSLTMTADGNGTTIPAGLASVEHSVAQQIIAVPNTGYDFNYWETTAGNANIAMATDDTTTATLSSGDATIRANFAIKTYSLSVTSAGNGTVNPFFSQTVDHGVATQITATPSPLYELERWYVSSGSAVIADSTSTVTTVTLTSGDATVTAEFGLINYDLTLSTDGNGSTIPTGVQSLEHGVADRIIAAPNTGYNFWRWTVVNGSADIAEVFDDTTYITLSSGNAEVRAEFTLKTYQLTISSRGTGTTLPAVIQTVNHGAATQVIAVPGDGHELDRWAVVDGSADIADSASDTTTVTLTSGEAAVQAVFQRKSYLVTLQAGTGGAVSPYPDTLVLHGDTLTLTAIPEETYGLLEWNVISGSAVLWDNMDEQARAVITEPVTIAAEFDNLVSILLSRGLLPTRFDLSVYGDNLHFDVPPLNGMTPVPLKINLYNMKGKMVRELWNKPAVPGFYRQPLRRESGLGSQLYLCNMRAREFKKTIKVLLRE
ncbi:hypothetical protein ACFL5V_02070 [Fibrobacterota bacterium]